MGRLLDIAQARQKVGGGRLLAIARGSGRRTATTLPDLQQQVAELEALQQVTGAPSIEQDKPGFFRRTIDVLSGFNFAAAGFLDEIGQGNGLGAAVSRASRELLSSARSLPFASLVIPEVQAEKETFGQVLEDLGVGTVSLADIVPALEGTIMGEWINTRGALGLALDIAADPLTYFSFGYGAAARRGFLAAGQKRLSRGLFSTGGDKLFRKELTALRGEMSDVLATGDVFRLGRELGLNKDTLENVVGAIGRGRALGGRTAAKDFASEMSEEILREGAFRRAVAKHGEEVVLDQGGIKWLGRSVVPGKTIRAINSKFGQPMVDAVRRFSWGDSVITSAENSYKKMRKTVVGIFHPFERLADVPESSRMAMIASARRFRRGGGMLEGRLRNRVDNADWFQHFQRNPAEVLEAMFAIEGKKTAGLALPLRRATEGMTEFFDELGRDAVALGMITEEQFSRRGGRYFAHFWENAPEEFSELHAQWFGKLATVSGKHNKERVYDTLERGVKLSKFMNEVSVAARKSGIPVKISPELIPNAVLDDVVGRYIRWYSQGKSRRLFAQEVSDTFGVAVEELTKEKLVKIFDGLDPRNISPATAEKISRFLDNPETSPLKKRRVVTEEIIEEPVPGSAGVSRRIHPTEGGVPSETGVSNKIFPTTTAARRIGFDRVELERQFRAITPEQQETIRDALVRLDSVDKSSRRGGFTKDRDLGTELANRMRTGGEDLNAADWVNAKRIVQDHTGQAERLIGRKLGLGPSVSRKVTGEEAVGGVIRREARKPDADVVDIEKSIQAGMDSEVTAESILNPLTDKERAFLKGLDREGRAEYLRQTLLEMNSQSQVVDFLAKYGDEFGFDLPSVKMDLTGQTEDIFRRFGEVEAEYVLRGGNNLWGDQVKFIPRLIAKYIDEADPRILNSKDWPALKAGLDKLNWINNWFKLGVYPLFPASGTRDLYSNVWFNSFRIGWHALNPKLWAQSVKILAHMSDSPKTIRAMERAMSAVGFDPHTITTRSGRKVSTAEAARQMRLRNVVLSAEELLEIDQASGRVFIRKKGERGVGPTIRSGAGKVIKEVREPLDNTSRVALATQNIIDDLSFDDAAEEVGRYLFHYNEIPAFSREFIAAAVPFARFSLKNIEFHFNMLRRRPGAVSNRLKPFRGREDERAEMARFRADALQIGLMRDGRTLRSVVGIDFPTRNLDLLWRGSTRRTLRMAAGMLSPVFKTPIEVATGTDLFTGQTSPRQRADSIGRFLEASNSPKWLKDWVGYTKRVDAAGRPRYEVDRQNLFVVFMRSWALSRVVSTSDRQFREFAGDEGAASMAVNILTGLRVEDIDFDQEQRRIFFERRRQLIEAGARRGVFRPFEVQGRADLEGLQ